MLHSILRVGENAAETKAREEEQSKEMQQRIAQLLSESSDAGAGARFTVIGYNEFQFGGKAEREYWVYYLDPSAPLCFAAGQIPMHCNNDESKRQDFCVLHLQYSGSDPSTSTVQRAAVRVTNSIELRAHQDKCRPCEVCRQKKLYKAYMCPYCTEFKWQNGYGQQYRGQHCGAFESLCARSTMAGACTLTLALDDARQRRFALVVGNSQYWGDTISVFEPLPGAVKDAQMVAQGLKQLGFVVRMLEDQSKSALEREMTAWTRTLPANAHALVFLSGHGMELKGGRFFVPVDYGKHHVSTIEATAKANCVTLQWVFGRIYSVLQQDGLIMAFWDCCREDALKEAEHAHVVRSGNDRLIRGMAQLKKKLAQEHYPLASWVCVYASSTASVAFEHKDGGVLTGALLAWWCDPEHACLSIGDEKVRDFVTNLVTERAEARSGKQKPVWESCGIAHFSFKAADESDIGSRIAFNLVTEMQTDPTPSGVHPSMTGYSEMTKAETEEFLTTFCHAADPVHGQPEGVALRQLGSSGVKSFLQELQRDSNIVTVVAKNDFPYKGRGLQPLIEREYWLRVKRSSLQDPALAGRDDFIILHVHYAGDWNRFDDQATFDQKRSTITQINARHTCDGSGPKFHKPCQDPGGELDRKWREERGTPVLGKTSGLKWKRIATKPSIGWELRNPKLEKALSNTLGLKWLKMGNTEPTGGLKLLISELTEALTHTTNFTRQEWENFSIKDLLVNHFVQAGGCYFKPACETDFTTEEWEAFGIDDLRDDNYIWGGGSYFKPAGSDISPDGWKWRDPAQRNLTDATPCLQDLLQKGELCTKVVRQKYVDLVAAHSQDAPQSSLETIAGATALGSGGGGTALHQSPSAHVVAWESSPNWATLPAPVPSVPPYRILFVGANSDVRSRLDLEGEVQQMQDAFFRTRGQISWGENVIFKHSFFSSAADLSRDLRNHDPAGLHFSCHGHASALALFGQDLVAQSFVKFIESWCASDTAHL